MYFNIMNLARDLMQFRTLYDNRVFIIKVLKTLKP